MNDDLRTRFQKAIEMKYHSGETGSVNLKTIQLDARKEFESTFDILISTIIAAALNEIAGDLLRPAGWICNVSRAIEGTGVIFTIYRPNSDGHPRARPNVSFLADTTLCQVWVQYSERSVSQSIGILKNNEITKDRIQEKVLEFFQKLG